MTSNQLKYWTLKEEERSNLATEREAKRANVTKEQETQRHNLTDEEIDRMTAEAKILAEKEGLRIKNAQALQDLIEFVATTRQGELSQIDQRTWKQMLDTYQIEQDPMGDRTPGGEAMWSFITDLRRFWDSFTGGKGISAITSLF